MLGPISSSMWALATFVRRQLADLPFWPRPDESAQQAVHEAAVVIMSAAAPFASTSYARARLLRQLYACGLLTADESETAVSLLEIARGA